MMIEAFLKRYRPAKSENTRNQYRSCLHRYKTFLEMRDIPADSARPSHLREFTECLKGMPNPRTLRPGMSESTIQTYLCAIRAYYRWRKARNRAMRNPGPEFRYHREQPARKVSPLTAEAVSRMCDSADNERDVAICILFQDTGLRLAELVALNKDLLDVETRNGSSGISRLGVYKVLGKGEKIRTVLISARAVDAISEYLLVRGNDAEPALFICQKRRISMRTVQRVIDRLSNRAGAGHAHAHQLRHSFGTGMVAAGMSEFGVQKRLGHRKRKTTHIYLETSQSSAMEQYMRAARSRNG